MTVAGLLHRGRATQHPEIFSERFPHNHPLVILIQIDDPIIAFERPEKPDLQFRVGNGVHDFGFTLKGQRGTGLR